MIYFRKKPILPQAQETKTHLSPDYVAQVFSLRFPGDLATRGRVESPKKPRVSRISRPRTHKVILKNKANFSPGSRNKDTSMRCDYLFSEEANSSVSSRNRDTSMRCDQLFSEEPNSSSSSGNQNTSIRHDDPFSKQSQFFRE